MATIKELKEGMQFNAGLIDLLEVMKSAAVFQFRSLQAKRERYDNFFKMLDGFFQFIGDNGRDHILMLPKTERRAVIMVTSDEGFMGNLNSQIINAAGKRDDFKEAELIIVGERGARYLKEMGRKFELFKSVVDASERRSLAEKLGTYIMSGIKEGRFGKLSIAYAKSISFMVQRVEVIDILPLAQRGVPSEKTGDKEELIIESPLDAIIDYLAGELVRQRLIDVLEESKLSEFAARAIHLEGSLQELAEKQKKVRSQYFKAYHEMIDKSTRELFSAQILIKR